MIGATSNVNRKVIIYNPELCTGCSRCMTTCSTYNNGITSLSGSRIQVARHEGHAITHIDEEDELVFLSMQCRQCDTPYCMEICPVEAISRNEQTEAMEVDYDKCIGCRMCVTVCPFGAMSYSSDMRKVIKCNLCDGDPQCVKFCPTGAIEFVPEETAHYSTLSKRAKAAMEINVRAARENTPGGGSDGHS